MGHGEAPGRGRGAKVSWSEAPLEPSLSFRDRLAMSGWEKRTKRCWCLSCMLCKFFYMLKV